MSSLLERTRDVSETEKALYTIVMSLLWANSSGRKLETPNVRRKRTRHLTPIVRNPSKTFMTGILTAQLRKSWWRGDKHLFVRETRCSYTNSLFDMQGVWSLTEEDCPVGNWALSSLPVCIHLVNEDHQLIMNLKNERKKFTATAGDLNSLPIVP